jgi:hypothetical protein
MEGIAGYSGENEETLDEKGTGYNEPTLVGKISGANSCGRLESW